MRSKSHLLASLTLLCFLGATYLTGCFVNTKDNCDLGGCTSCIPSQVTGAVEDACGIFASSSIGDDDNPGTKGMPVKTIATAIELASSASRTVYGCAEQFQESVDLTSNVRIYGGLDCTNGWAYIGDTQKTMLTTGPDVIPLKLESGISTTIQDLHVLAPAATVLGGSSIAVIADGATAEFVGCTLEAANGAPGQHGAQVPMQAPAGEDGVPGGTACSASQVAGLEGPKNDCGGIVSLGGSAGSGGTYTGSLGNSGYPEISDNGGSGATTTTNCTDGGNGEYGTDGSWGANGMGLGTIDKNGYIGVAGADGIPGTPGQGGGGGGGSKGGTGAGKCPSSTSAGGASGGSGGSGGCGGAGGKGGGPGGASIALVSIQGNVTLESTQLVAKNGGEPGIGSSGGVGSGGGAGGMGGSTPSGATMLMPGCRGGAGGIGGNGGNGGNGVGGHSIGIAFNGPAPTFDAATMFTTGVQGLGGVTQDMQEFL